MNTCGFGWCASVFACANQTSPGAENRCRSMGVAMLCSTSPTLSSETLPPQGHRQRERERERDIVWSVWGRKKVKDQYGNQRCLKSRNRACVCFSHFHSPCSLSLSCCGWWLVQYRPLWFHSLSRGHSCVWSRADLKGESGHSARKLHLKHSDETFCYGFVTITNLYSFKIILILKRKKTNSPPFYLKKLCTSAFKGIVHPKMIIMK